MTHFAAMRREYSALSVLLVAVFVITLSLAVLIDLAGLLQWIGLIGGLPRVLEPGAALTALTVFPLLAMGMSITNDVSHKRHKLSRLVNTPAFAAA